MPSCVWVSLYVLSCESAVLNNYYQYMIARVYDILSVNQCTVCCANFNANRQYASLILSEIWLLFELKKANTHNLMDLLPTKKKINRQHRRRFTDIEMISKFRYFYRRYRYDTIWPISTRYIVQTRYIVWTIYRCITIDAIGCRSCVCIQNSSLQSTHWLLTSLLRRPIHRRFFSPETPFMSSRYLKLNCSFTLAPPRMVQRCQSA